MLTDSIPQPHRHPSATWLLVMTATIQPAANANVQRANPAVRLADYQRALRFWLAQTHPSTSRILFLENSGSDLSSLRAIAEHENSARKPVEFLSIPAGPIPSGLNYGYSEMELLDAGLDRSELRRETTHMIKTTGRLIFPSLPDAIERLPTAPELLIDCRRFPWPRHGADARVQLFVASHAYYDRHLRGSQRSMNATTLRLLEQLIYARVIGTQGQPGVYLRFPCNIDPIGYSGFKGRSYQSLGERFDQLTRAFLRRVAPAYWY